MCLTKFVYLSTLPFQGQLFVNGQNMGRYWPKKGPQVRLYIPKFALQSGPNTILLAEMEISPCGTDTNCYIELMDTPLINATVPPNAHNTQDHTSVISYVFLWFRICIKILYGGLEAFFLSFVNCNK